jgi:NitT/TauT family transport system substrate-binding protein
MEGQPMRAVLALWLGLVALAACASPAAPLSGSTGPSAPAAVPAAGGAAPAAPAAAPAPAPPAAPTLVKVGANIGASDAGIFLAIDRGYFAEQGIEIEIVRGAGSDQVAALATGDLDVGAAAVSAGLLNAMARDLPLRVVADKGSDPPGFSYQAIVLRKELVDSGQVRGWADLRGRKLAAASVRSSVDFLIARGLGEVGLTLDDVDLVQIAYPDINAALANGVIDGASFWEPLLTVGADQGILVRWKGIDEIDPGHQSGTLLYGTSLLAGNPDLGRRFMLAYVRAARVYNDAFRKGQGRAEVVASIAKHTGVAAELVERGVPVGLNPDGCANARDLTDQLAWFRAQGYLQRDLELDVVLDNQFCEQAAQQLGRYTYCVPLGSGPRGLAFGDQASRVRAAAMTAEARGSAAAVRARG